MPLDEPQAFLLFVAEPSPLWGCHYPTLDRLSDRSVWKVGKAVLSLTLHQQKEALRVFLEDADGLFCSFNN